MGRGGEMFLDSFGKAYVLSDFIAWTFNCASGLDMYITFGVLYIVTGQALWTLDKTLPAESLVE
jgi:hypothetical protein